MILSTLTAKLAAAGIAAKAAAATGVVAVALTGAATAGALPGQQDAAVVESSDPTDVSDVSQDATTDGSAPDGTVTDGTVSDGTVTDGTVSDGADNDGTVTDGADNDGTGDDSADAVADESGDGDVVPVADPAPEAPETSEGHKPTDDQKAARHPENHGAAVSDAAHRRNAQRKAEREQAQPGSVAPEDEQAVEVLEAEQAPVVEQPAAPAPHPGNGNGNGNGKK
jgi:hypothetical protein